MNDSMDETMLKSTVGETHMFGSSSGMSLRASELDVSPSKGETMGALLKAGRDSKAHVDIPHRQPASLKPKQHDHGELLDQYRIFGMLKRSHGCCYRVGGRGWPHVS